MSWITSEFELYVQTVKCGDYFQAEDGPRDFGNISIVTKWIKTTDTSLLLRNLKVGYKEVSFIYLHLILLSNNLLTKLIFLEHV
jgi:hypothetical protein